MRIFGCSCDSYFVRCRKNVRLDFVECFAKRPSGRHRRTFAFAEIFPQEQALTEKLRKAEPDVSGNAMTHKT